VTRSAEETTPADVAAHLGDAGRAPDVVRAAGAVCWRRRQGAIQVLLVHRPRYRDWSFPKGKLDPGEVSVVAGVREVEEETGLHVRLGRPLPTAHYRLRPGADKEVAYWAAQVEADTPPPPHPDEVDQVRWTTSEEADRRLTRRGDRVQLEALLAAEADGALETWPFVVVRHGHAYPKSAWGRDDADRPLVTAGLRQAGALTALLRAWAPERVLSSPWKRCTDTVAPYATLTGVRVKSKGRLSENGHRRDPAKVAALVGRLLDARRPVAVCTHRPVLGTLLGTLAGHASAGVAADLPAHDPFLRAGEVLVAHVSRRGRVVAVERHAPLPEG
jgi:8-oxo-(d)GTP phosphatase